ncbi:hypothetical protein [Pseudomonas aeruginosa]|uniref:hypothetical protein n=1 Tax=Pseudomonas aeruginosa TaxID=287 RepID=UPI002E28C963|nr:hypothetical protein [Pseudomonas aeruginosa]HBN9511485.1 hypothetical protein [Pseudomonas aeruginosa]HBN9782220.1 hypothetical protein [Pseudomonas aeruginosa]HBN9851871.1 hypothetical protein [Pseudomonas aeruginosa]HBN9865279.1 hypothetical protein [Pseudomonas aeruginosa]HBN9896629.1 hypothetical protein [Pseudomonas aeruginosa]
MHVIKGNGLRLLVILASAFAVSACDWFSSEDYLAKCDALASHPDDPDRYAAGVQDPSLAPGAVIEACSKAVKAHPSLARAHFQLGRAYLVTNRHAEAFAAFLEAADLGHAGAKKYIGDAFVNGLGLPDGVESNAGEAMRFYKESAAGGFMPANKAIEEVGKWLAKERFDPTVFQNPHYMAMLYAGDFSKLQGTQDAVGFISYVKGMAEMLDSEQMMDHDSDCKPLLSKVGFVGIDLAGLAVTVGAIQRADDYFKLFLAFALSSFTYDQGQRDVVTLSIRHGCDGQVAQTVIKNLMTASMPVAKQQTTTVGAAHGTTASNESRAIRLRSLYVQTCTLKAIDDNGQFLPEAVEAQANGTFKRHFDRVSDIVNEMKTNPQSDLNRILLEGGNHAQILVSSPYSPDTSVRVVGIQASGGDIRYTRCPDKHIRRIYSADAWLMGSGIAPAGLKTL